ncbi:heat shock 70 kDa protein 14 isoform X1 [Neodiprion lecontei]|uniref:Heat shock 70 kDa protein 14 isoform X1 n=2 Tax=Neodiprion lecontei TaxID=441921 RepID=A0A6J0C0L2_NEOLC|nr:heat shock 70 kDa protein 14 isoform X1 [Neodiprion lecontei]
MASVAAFGLYLGNTSACLAIFKDDNVDVVANEAGERVTAAVVAFNETEEVIGLAAKAGLFRNGPVSVLNNKRLMNKNIDETELELAVKSSTCKIITEKDTVQYLIKRNERMEKILPVEVATRIFEVMYSISTTAAHDDNEHNVVLCVPLRFSSASIQMWSKSASSAGFRVLQVISEPAAACLAYGIGQDRKESGYVLVYRIGGVSSEITLVKVVSGIYQIVSTSYYHDLGGNKLTKILAEYLAGEFMSKWKLDPMESRRSMSKLNIAAETCKHVLSTMSTAHCFVESLCDGVDFSYNITRARFENLINSNISEYIAPVDKILKETKLGTDDISKIILSGGTMKIPKLQEKIGALFSNGEVCSGKWSPDECMAIGAAMQSALLLSHGTWDESLQSTNMEVNALQKSLYIQIEELKPIIIPAKTVVPIKLQTRVEVPEVKDGKINLKIYEQDSEDVASQKKIGLICIPANSGAQLKVDTDLTEASLNVNITDAKSGQKSSFRFGIHEDDS